MDRPRAGCCPPTACRAAPPRRRVARETPLSPASPPPRDLPPDSLTRDPHAPAPRPDGVFGGAAPLIHAPVLRADGVPARLGGVGSGRSPARTAEQ
jgi:hypothetical protein